MRENLLYIRYFIRGFGGAKSLLRLTFAQRQTPSLQRASAHGAKLEFEFDFISNVPTIKLCSNKELVMLQSVADALVINLFIHVVGIAILPLFEFLPLFNSHRLAEIAHFEPLSD